MIQISGVGQDEVSPLQPISLITTKNSELNTKRNYLRTEKSKEIAGT